MIEKAPILSDEETARFFADPRAQNLDLLVSDFYDRLKYVAEAQRDADHQYYPRVIGELLCVLIGNTMLKNMEEGKLLAEQLRPMIALLKEAGGE